MDASKTSPISSHYGNTQHQYYYGNVTSPSNSDGNQYPSPVVSPGYWNSASPNPNTVSPQSHGSFQGTPNSSTSKEVRASPPSSPPSSFQAPTLPARLGNQEAERAERAAKAENNRFLQKSSMDREREKLASRRVQSMMIEASRKKHREYGQVATQNEPMPTEDVNGSVNDFKCEFDRDREWAAKKHAMRMITKLKNAC